MRKDRSMSDFKLYPAILTMSDIIAQSQLTISDTLETAEVTHIDVVDGWFADNLTISPSDFAGYEYGDNKIDVHLMVEEPLDYVYELIAVKDTVPVRAVIVQAERVSGLVSVLEEIRQQGWQAGVSINIGSDVEDVIEDVGEFAGHVSIWQAMGVPAGFQGNRFNVEALATLQTIVTMAGGLYKELLVDGGIQPEILHKIIKAGATGAVVGSFIWKAQNPVVQWDILRAELERHDE